MVSMEAHRRAARFPIATSVLFREHGGSEWHQGSTVNISCSGVLCRSREPLPGPGDSVDFILTLPVNDRTPASRVRCTGHVVRIGHEEPAAEGRAVAITIDRYALGPLRP